MIKNIFYIIMFGSLVLLSCSPSKKKETNDPFKNCLPKSFGDGLSLLEKSFNGFVQRNYEGDISKFITAISTRDFPQRNDFIRADSKISQALRSKDFDIFIYTEYEEDYDDFGIQAPRTSNQNDPPKPTQTKVDSEKPFMICLRKVPTEGKLIKEYIKLRIENPTYPPSVIAKLFLNNKTDKDFQTSLAKTIIAVELYYMILDALS